MLGQYPASVSSLGLRSRRISSGDDAPITRTADYTDVTVVDAESRRLPWNGLSHIGDDEMRDFRRQVVAHLLTFCHLARNPEFLRRIESYTRPVRQWGEPYIEAGFLAATLTAR